MSLSRLDLNFAARRGIAGRLSWVILAGGVIAVTGLLVTHSQLSNEVQGLTLHLEEYAPSPAANEHRLAAATAMVSEVRSVAVELGTPWNHVLEDLEEASRDSRGSVAVLSIAPDRSRGKLTLVAEARTLTAALTYMQRLQKSRAIAHPLLDSHEVRAEVAERPVRVQITADWRTST